MLGMHREPRVVDNLLVGKPQVAPDAPAHQRGVHEGNKRGNLERNPGVHPVDAWSARGSARRSTGINPRGREPIDPRMPCLSPP
jgi:hypothetical protein